MASPVSQDELVEEQARRSIVVSSIPENLTDKDIIIHFQRTRNGGGEVDSAGRYLDSTDTSVVVVTFEQPETVESVINRPQIINGAQVDVERYTAPVTIPEVFEQVHAIVNPYIFSSSGVVKHEVLQFLEEEFGVQYKYSNSRRADYLTGSFKEIELCHKYLVEHFLTSPNKKPPRRTTSRDKGTINDPFREEIDEPVVYRTVPILLRYISSVPKYRQQFQDIEQMYKVKISSENDGYNVNIKSMPGCIQKQFIDGCDKFIDLYQKLHGGPMKLKEQIFQPGPGSNYLSVDEAIGEVLQNAPVIIEKATTKDTWQFYGEENDVKSAINDVCKLLCISNPMKTSSRKRAPETTQNPQGTARSCGPDRYEAMDQEELPRPQDLANSQATSPVDDTFSPSTGDGVKEVFVTKKGFTLTVQKSDITEEQADVIVSCNDEYLTWFGHGLAKSIVDKAGQDVIGKASAQKKKKKPGDIIVTNAGKLHCHKIMHIILWNGKKNKDVARNIVHNSVVDCLRKVQSKKMKSIAFPVVGANQKTQMELKHCACAMVSAMEKYMAESNPQKNAVSDIRCILIDPAAFEVFKVELTKRYGDCRVINPITNPQPRTDDTGIRSDNSSAGRQGYERKKTHDNDKKDDEDDCAICLEKPTDPTTLEKCKHRFCRLCIDKAFQHNKKCPTCGMAYGVQKGNMPYGTMYDITKYYMHLPGYQQYGTIEIRYDFPTGTQGPEHPNPGQWYNGTSRTAYLPDCPEGREVLGLLKKAFDARLTFTIGTSVTTGQQNTVTWNDIHHKTNPYGGATGFGYPDPGYLKRVKEELAAKGIS